VEIATDSISWHAHWAMTGSTMSCRASDGGIPGGDARGVDCNTQWSPRITNIGSAP
jgi:hypothetical protein